MLLLSDLENVPGALRKLIDDQQGPRVQCGSAMSLLADGSEMARKLAFEQRLLVLRQRHVLLLRLYVARFYATPSIRDGILQHIDTLKNLLKMTTDAIAVAYTVPPSRSLRDIPDEQQRAFLEAYREGDVDLHAEQWNRYAFALNVVHVVPRWENGELTFTTVLPHNADVVFDPAGEREPSILVWGTRSHGASYIAADSEQFQWLDSEYRVLYREPHNLGMRPWVAWRWEAAPEDDYWNRGAGQDLLDGTLKVARIYAQMNWVRKTHSKKLLHIHTGEATSVAENQQLQAEAPFATEGNDAATLTVHDVIVATDEFQKEMREVAESVLEAYGLPGNAIDFNTESTKLHEALVKIRNKQVKMFERAELQLALRVNVLLRQAGRSTLTDAQIKQAFRIKHAPLSSTDPGFMKARMEAAKAQMELGQTDPYLIYQQDNPECTEQEARENVGQHVENRAEFYRTWVEHNMPLDPANDLRTAAQLNGAIGGTLSGESRRSESDDAQDNPS
jgi:hypothetical protein